MLMDSRRSFLLVIDVQEKLLPVMEDPDGVLRNAAILADAAARLSVPVVHSEQYPKGIGPTVAALGEKIPGRAVEKLAFSCLAEDACANAIRACGAGQGRTQAVVVGIEAHVCVLQTVMDLLAGGYEVFVVADAVSSRLGENAHLALDRMAGAGAVAVSTEMVVFEWLRRAGTDDFKALSKLIK